MAVSAEVRRFLDNLIAEATRFESTLPEVGAEIRDVVRAIEARNTTSLTRAQALAKEAGLDQAVVRRALSDETTDEQADSEMARLTSRFEAPLAAEQERVATNTAAEDLEAQAGGELSFARDARGDVATDGLGRPIIEGDINGETMVWDATLGRVDVAYLPDEEDGPPLIGGFPDDYKIEEPEKDARLRAAQELMGVRRETTPNFDDRIGARPRYYDFDQWRDFATKSPEYQSMVQSQLVAAGLLDEDDFIPGAWTFEAARAMELAMAESNATSGRLSWVDVLRQRAQGREEAGVDEETRSLLASRRLVLPAFREPDYASLSTNVKDLFRNQLGRDPVDWEVALLADQLNADYRKAYDADVSALTAEFEAGNRAILESDATDAASIQGAGTVPAVDPISRLRERFEKKYASEFELGEDRIAERQNVSNVFSILTKTNNLMSGGVAS